MLTGPNNTAFVLSAVTTLELRVFGVANVPYMLNAPVLITTVLLWACTLMAIFPLATGMLILVAPLAIWLADPALSPVMYTPLPYK